MARIRIVDEWRRSPVSVPERQRAIMVVARQWAEQRVLMRAFAACHDQTRPTINLYGAELAIGPAGTDPHGEWGIHVEPPVDGRAQELREALELAAKLLAGSKGNPPRLEDEVPAFDDRVTNHWAPSPASSGNDDPANYYEPSDARSQLEAKPRQRPNLRKTPPVWGHDYDSPQLQYGNPPGQVNPVTPSTPRQVPKAKFRTVIYNGAAAPATPPRANSAALPMSSKASAPSSGALLEPTADQSPAAIRPPRRRVAAKTMHGFSSAQSNRDSYAIMAGKTMPLGFQLADRERAILNALGDSVSLSASEIGALLQIDHPMHWMAALMDKLAEFGLDLVAPGDDRDGEPTYILTR